MKIKHFVFVTLGALSFIACNSQNSAVKIETETDSISYALGVSFGSNIKTNFEDLELNYDVLAKAIQDYYEDNEMVFSPEEANEKLNQFFMKKQQEASSGNAEKASAFLEENKKKKDVKVTESGLQYKVIKEGEGEKPETTDKVKVHYKGTLLDGTTFDSSYERGEPASFRLEQVIPGWTEGLQLMSEGAKYKFFIPPHLGYGERAPQGSAIKPNSLLIFEVELISIEEE